MTRRGKKKPWWCEIYEAKLGKEADTLVKKLGPYALEQTAERAEEGVNRNLNHENFYTKVTQ